MQYQELLDELKNPEKETCELKTSFNEWDEIAKTIASFSTKKGGKIFVGIDRRGLPIGTTCGNEIKGKLHGLANNEIKPAATISIDIISHDVPKNLSVVCIHVQKGNGVFGFKGVHYERRGDTNHPLTAEEIFNLQKNIKKIFFDELPSYAEERPALISDIDIEKIRKYLETTKHIRESIDIERFLSNHSYLVNGTKQVKNAAVMIFGSNPQKFLPQMKVSISIFAGNTITDQFVKKELIGDIKEIFDKTYVEILRNMNTYSFIEETKRIDIPEYPPTVIRECLINALVHRDYTDRNTETFIKIFSDRIEFVNPAKFPFECYSFDEIKKTKLSIRRNPLIASYFEEVGLMEQEGRGLTIIEEGLKEHGLPAPVFNANENIFMVIIFGSEDKGKLKSSPNKMIVNFDSLNDRQNKLISHMEKTKIPISRIEYIKLLKSSGQTILPLTATRDLNELVKKNVLTPIGSKRGTKYVLT